MRFLFQLSFLLLLSVTGFSQAIPDTSLSSAAESKFINSISNKYNAALDQISNATEKAVRKAEKAEYRIYRRLYKKDTTAARAFLAESRAKYDDLRSLLSGQTSNARIREYIPYHDSIQTSLAYLESRAKLRDSLTTKFSDAKKILERFEGKYQVANKVKTELRKRKAQLAQRLENFGMVKELQKFSKTAYYYQEQLKEIKSTFADPGKAQRKALAILRKSRPFKEFMKQHSMLARLFRVPEDYGNKDGLGGLQTRIGIQDMLSRRLVGAGIDPNQYMQQQVSQARIEIDKLKSKLNKLGSGSSGNIEMPDKFKPNTQKIKPFFKRFEYGVNIQTQKVNSFFPVTTDLAFNVGYKLNDKSVVGIGAAYKIGWGSSIENVKLTSEGIGLRSYADLKLKGSLWISGGYEQNYYQRLNSIQQFSNIDVWKHSALLGLTKKIRLKGKTGKVQILYDFFNSSNNVRTRPLLFRVEYGF